MKDFNWVELCLLLGAVQGFLLALVLPKLTKANKEANRILSILLVVVSFAVVLFLNSYIYKIWPVRMQVFLDSLAFLFAPLIYLYFQKLLLSREDSTLDYLHFLPFLLHFLYGISILKYSNQEMSDRIDSGGFIVEWGTFFIALILSTLIYWFACVRMLLNFKRHQKRVSAFRQNLIYLSVFLVALLLGDLISIVFGLHHFFGIELVSGTDIFISWIIIPFLVYFITYMVIGKPEILRIEYQPIQSSIHRIAEEQIEEYKNQLEKSMKEQKLYLDPQLTLTQLALILHMKPTQLSWLINKGYNSNFYDFVNSYRTKEFVKKLKNNEHKNHTLLALAYDAGFNSKTTFNKSFKKTFHSTPSEYLRKLSSS